MTETALPAETPETAPEFSIIIPALNEEGSIEQVLTELFEVMGAAAFEVIVADDGSTDETPAILNRMATDPAFAGRLFTCRHAAPCGKASALRTAAHLARAPWLLTMDADGQNDPRDFTAMRAPTLESGPPALVCGIRTSRQTTGARRVASKIANWIRRTALNDDCPDTACGVKYIRRDLFLDLPLFDGQHRFYPALTKLYGHRTANVPVSDRSRMAGQSKYTNLGRAIVGIFDLMGVVWLRKRTTPPAPADK